MSEITSVDVGTLQPRRHLKSASSKSNKGLNLVRESKFEKARHKLRKALKAYIMLHNDVHHISIAPVHEILGHVEMKLGALDEAKLHFSAASEICEDHLKLLDKKEFEDNELKDMLAASILRIRRGLNAIETERYIEGKTMSVGPVSEQILNCIATDMKKYDDIDGNTKTSTVASTDHPVLVTETANAAVKKPELNGTEDGILMNSQPCSFMDGPSVLSDDTPPMPVQSSAFLSQTGGSDSISPSFGIQSKSERSNAVFNKTEDTSSHKANDNRNKHDSIVIELPITQPAVGIPIPEAFVVEDPPEIASAEILPPDKYALTVTIAGRKLHLGIFVFVAMLVLALVVGIVVNAVQGPDADVDIGANKRLSLREQDIMNALEKHVLQRNITFGGLQWSDVRITALNWLINDDPKQLTGSDPSLFQRFILALLVFQSGFGVSDFYNDGDECDWKGVQCVGRNVTSLRFYKTLLIGTLPPELGRLQSLKNLIMKDCSLYGSLPSEIGDLELLTYLDLGNNQLDHKCPSPNRFEGPIPAEIGRLRHLTWLDFRHNELTSIPTDIGNLKQLTHFCIGNNSFVGDVPADIGDCS